LKNEVCFVNTEQKCGQAKITLSI